MGPVPPATCLLASSSGKAVVRSWPCKTAGTRVSQTTSGAHELPTPVNSAARSPANVARTVFSLSWRSIIRVAEAVRTRHAAHGSGVTVNVDSRMKTRQRSKPSSIVHKPIPFVGSNVQRPRALFPDPASSATLLSNSTLPSARGNTAGCS